MNSDLSQYEVDIDLDNPNSSHAQVARLVGTGRRVLDIGCWTGDLGRVLRRRGCRVSGIEQDPHAAEKARADYEEVAVLDLDRQPASGHFAQGSFDVVVLADVLEHLLDPGAVLADVVGLLGPGGRIVASIPNVAHGSVRLALLQGRWRYTSTGLVDDTHVRFFDRAHVLRLFENSGLLIDELGATTADPLEVEVAIDADRLPATVVEWVRDQPDAMVYQFILAAHAAGKGESQDPAGLVLRPAAPEDSVRLADVHTERMQADREARHRLLTVRDHMIGLEAAAATAQTRAEVAERQLKGARKRLERKNSRIQELSQQSRRQPQAANEPAPSLARSVAGRIRSGRVRE